MRAEHFPEGHTTWPAACSPNTAGRIPKGEALFHRKVWKGDTVFYAEVEQLKSAVLCLIYTYKPEYSSSFPQTHTELMSWLWAEQQEDWAANGER